MDRLLAEQSRILCKLLRGQSRSVKAKDMIELHSLQTGLDLSACLF